MKTFLTALFIFLFAFLAVEVGSADAYGRNVKFRSNTRHSFHNPDHYGRNVKFRTNRIRNNNSSYGINIRY